jgi:hypothetical protein
MSNLYISLPFLYVLMTVLISYVCNVGMLRKIFVVVEYASRAQLWRLLFNCQGQRCSEIFPSDPLLQLHFRRVTLKILKRIHAYIVFL